MSKVAEHMQALLEEFKMFQHRARLTPSEKQRVREVCAELGIEHNFKSACSSCYRDAILLVLLECRKVLGSDTSTAASEGVRSESRYMLRMAITWRGKVYDPATITDKEAEQIARWFPHLITQRNG